MKAKTPVPTIDEYISAFPEEIQVLLEKIRQIIHEAIPEATETIRYGIPTFDLNGQYLVFFAGWKQSLSLYPLPAGDAVLPPLVSLHHLSAFGIALMASRNTSATDMCDPLYTNSFLGKLLNTTD